MSAGTRARHIATPWLKTVRSSVNTPMSISPSAIDSSQLLLCHGAPAVISGSQIVVSTAVNWPICPALQAG